ncbi:unnamed protein product [Blepharisma stoltei]|uniref:Dynein regulatory complex protein 10 n=1 Tax=Blepharisma stoltei TaxID=1481888 RepID=A0AAU9I9H5_9CILI|nr:unnamed protein product [Blepharisma stoltei]
MGDDSIKLLLRIAEDILFSLNLPEAILSKYKSIREAAIYKADVETMKTHSPYLHRLDVSHEIIRNYSKVMDFMIAGMSTALEKHNRILEIVGKKVEITQLTNRSRAMEVLLRDLPKLTASRKEFNNDILDKFRDLEENELENLKAIAQDFEEFENQTVLAIDKVKEALLEKEQKMKEIENELSIISINAAKETEKIQEYQLKFSPRSNSARSSQLDFHKMKNVDELIMENMKLNEEKEEILNQLEKAKNAYAIDLENLQHKYEIQIQSLIDSHEQEKNRLNELKNSELEEIEIANRERENNLLEKLEKVTLEDTGVLKEMRINMEKLESTKMEYVNAYNEAINILQPLYEEFYAGHHEWIIKEKSRKKFYKGKFNKQFIDLLIKCEFALFLIEIYKNENDNLGSRLEEIIKKQESPQIIEIDQEIIKDPRTISRLSEISHHSDTTKENPRSSSREGIKTPENIPMTLSEINKNPEKIDEKIKQHLKTNGEVLKNFEKARTRLLDNIQNSKESKSLSRSDTFENLYTKYLLKS